MLFTIILMPLYFLEQVNVKYVEKMEQNILVPDVSLEHAVWNV